MDLLTLTKIFTLLCISFSLLYVVYYLVQVLQELKKTLEQVEDVIDDTKTVTQAISKPATSFAEVFDNVKVASVFISQFVRELRGRSKKKS